ncbi:uncharacterized protein LOC142566166 isoform X2 [Dermacentor variabilis]|uniref:uncharacterized protein LOC142566166 isoform X2 n=1 Tax=Dermacentor variabilis TaxID=34621 RepID=UPI003F5B6718
MGRVTKFPTSRCPTGTQGQATSLPLMSSLSRTNTISDLLKRRKKRRSRILTRNRASKLLPTAGWSSLAGFNTPSHSVKNHCTPGSL